MANQKRNKHGDQSGEKEREGMSREEAGQLGGEATLERYGPDFYGEIGHKGGEATSESHGHEFYEEIGRKGGQKTAETHGPDFYGEIGRKGGQAHGEYEREESDQ